MQRRYHTLVVLLLTVFSVVGLVSTSLSPLAAPARAQVVTPDPSPPSFENQRFVIGSDNITTKENPTTFATADLPDLNAFPTTTVLVHNYEGFGNDQRFWLSVRIRHQDAGVEVVPEPGYAQMGLIAPGGDAEYTVTFPDTTSARVEFEVNGSTEEAAMLTILQFALESGLTAANLTGLGSHSQELGLALAEVVAEQYLADLPTLTPCANAVAAVQRGLTDQEQFTRDVQGCLESPIWQASIDQVLARVAERDWFQQALNAAGLAVPQLGLALKAVEATQFAARVWTMYDKFHPEIPGAMVGTVAFLSIDTTSQVTLGAATTSPEGTAPEFADRLAALPPEDLLDLLPPEAVLDLLVTTPFTDEELPTFLSTPLVVEEWQNDSDLEGAVGGVLASGEDTGIGYIVYPTVSDAQMRIGAILEAAAENADVELLPSTQSNAPGHPTTVIRSYGGYVIVFVHVANTAIFGQVQAIGPIAEEQALALAEVGVAHLERLMAIPDEQAATSLTASEILARTLLTVKLAGTFHGETHSNDPALNGSGEVDLQELAGRFISSDGNLEVYLVGGRLFLFQNGTWSAPDFAPNGLFDPNILVQTLEEDIFRYRTWYLREPVISNGTTSYFIEDSTGYVSIWINSETFLPSRIKQGQFGEVVFLDFGVPVDIQAPSEDLEPLPESTPPPATPAADISVFEVVGRTQAAVKQAGTYKYEDTLWDASGEQTYSANGEVIIGGGRKFQSSLGAQGYVDQNGKLYVQDNGGPWYSPITTGGPTPEPMTEFLDTPVTDWSLLETNALDGQHSYTIERIGTHLRSGSKYRQTFWIDAESFLPLKRVEKDEPEESWSMTSETVFSDFGAPVDVDVPPEVIQEAMAPTPTPEPANPLTSSDPTAIADGFLAAIFAQDLDRVSQYFAPDQQPNSLAEALDLPFKSDSQALDLVIGCSGLPYTVVERQTNRAQVSFVFPDVCANRNLYAGGGDLSNQINVFLEDSTGSWYVDAVYVPQS